MDHDRAERDLIDWGITNRDRDTRILRGLLAGIPKNRISLLTGVARNTITNLLKDEYPTVDTAAVLRAMARAHTGMTAPEFDHSLAAGDGRAVQAMNSAAYLLANEDHPDDDLAERRRQRAEDVWNSTWPEIEAMVARAKTMKFLGWSTEAQVRGQKIRYADPNGDAS